jgi:hypothetical protein
MRRFVRWGRVKRRVVGLAFEEVMVFEAWEIGLGRVGLGGARPVPEFLRIDTSSERSPLHGPRDWPSSRLIAGTVVFAESRQERWQSYGVVVTMKGSKRVTNVEKH